MRVVVAGSSGFIGSALVAHLRGGGHDVVRLVRREPTAADERRWDPPAGKIDDGALDGAGAVVNLCGAPLWTRRWSDARKQVLINSRVEPTEVLAAAVAEHGVPVLLNQSAVGYYGDTTGGARDESAPRGEGFAAALCERWEQATAAASGARVVLMRTAPVLAARGGMLTPLRPLFTLALGAKLGSGEQYMPWIHVDDLVSATTCLLEADVSGPVNLTGPTPATNTEFTKAFGRARNRPALFSVPRPAMRIAMGELAEDLLRSQHVVPAALRGQGFQFRFTTVAEALADTERG